MDQELCEDDSLTIVAYRKGTLKMDGGITAIAGTQFQEPKETDTKGIKLVEVLILYDSIPWISSLGFDLRQ